MRLAWGKRRAICGADGRHGRLTMRRRLPIRKTPCTGAPRVLGVSLCFRVMTAKTVFLVLHMAGNLLWIGGIAAVAVALATAGTASTRRSVALAIYKRVAVPGFIASLLGGGVQLFMNTSLYFVQSRWMHPKLTLVVAVIALHHILGARAKRLSEDGPSKRAGAMGTALVICAVSAAFLSLAKPF